MSAPERIDLAALERLERPEWQQSYTEIRDRPGVTSAIYCESASLASALTDYLNAAPHLFRVVRAALTLMDEFENEEEEYGFPLNFALRDAHRELRTATMPFLAGCCGVEDA